MDSPTTTPVAIVGGGPVGLLLALLLDQQGVRSTVFNTAGTVPDQPRGSTHNARTMELYRRLGLSERVRGLGLPADHSAGISFFTRYSGAELAILPWPGPAETARLVSAADRADQVPEPLHRANQMYVERLLLDHARTRPRIDLRFGWQVGELSADAEGVSLTARHEDTSHRWTAAYAVGCDGGRSLVRRTLGIRYQGEGGLQQDVLGSRSIAAHLRIPRLSSDFLRGRRAWSNWAVNADLALNLIALDGGTEFFLLTSSLDPGTAGPDDIAWLVQRAAGAPLEVEVLSHRPWAAGAALVAERFAAGRMLLAGDAAHLFTPNGGFGMNTGVEDAANLAWKLAGAVQGWAGPRLLDSYEAERRPVALRNTRAARELGKGLGAIRRPAHLEEDSERGAAARQRLGQELAEYGQLTLDTLGVQLGARYDGSPVVDAGQDGPPGDSFTSYTPSGTPGGRAPHVWLDEVHGPGSSLFDQFGTGFTLLDLGGSDESRSLAEAAHRRRIPLKVLHTVDQTVRKLYEAELVLIRPDQYIAWRGGQAPDAPAALLERVTGH
ncbi:FAD-dependent monooxygenase [Streptacidiphilus anmyonensis]|uniref:FAD-dependent monooxygenase n=1 Tax=Streptacidiphilus anmyonensis TaxID=405782 RepID=UPI0005A99AEE|nr:FAD-dependent monooxygenase [Streptacidiphilus anmyonensis]